MPVHQKGVTFATPSRDLDQMVVFLDQPIGHQAIETFLNP